MGDEQSPSQDLDTVAGWRARARLVRPDAAPTGGTQAEPLYCRRDTVPIESEADLDATSAAPAHSRVPGRYDYG
jgi:hypothetical protein